MTIYRFNIRTTFKHGFNLGKLKDEILNSFIIKKRLLNITNDRAHPYIMLIEFQGFLNVKEENELNTILKHHRYGAEPTTPTTSTSTPTITSAPIITSHFVVNETSVSGILTSLEDIVLNSVNNTISIDGYNGVDIGNNVSDGPINIATTQNTRNVKIGNTATGTNIAVRYGGSLSFTQYNETVLPSDVSIELDFGSILSGIIYGNPTDNTTIIMPNAQAIIFYEDDIQPNDGYDFSLINLSSTYTYTLSTDASFTVIGNSVIDPNTSGSFRLKVTSTTFESEACTLFRLA